MIHVERPSRDSLFGGAVAEVLAQPLNQAAMAHGELMRRRRRALPVHGDRGNLRRRELGGRRPIPALVQVAGAGPRGIAERTLVATGAWAPYIGPQARVERVLLADEQPGVALAA